MVKVWIRELPSFQTPKIAYENSMLGVFSCDITVVASDVIMQRTQRCLGLSETRQVNRYVVIWLARALRALEASQHVIGLMATEIWDNIGSGNGLLPDLLSIRSTDIHLRAVLQKIFKPPIFKN